MSAGPKMPSLLDEPTGNLEQRIKASAGGGDGLRGLLSGQTPKLILAILAFVTAGIILYVQLGGNDNTAPSRVRKMIDAETGEVFSGFEITDGQTFPLTNPKTGKKTLYQAETCYWTKDGQAKYPGTPVFFKGYLGKGEETICPDCGRKVVFNNPAPPADLMEKARKAAEGKK